MAKEHLGFIGVGRMGGPMARRLIEAGYQLTIYDTNEVAMAPLCALGASRAASAAQVASAAEAVFASLPTPEIVAAVAEAPAATASGPSSISRRRGRACRPRSPRGSASIGSSRSILR